MNVEIVIHSKTGNTLSVGEKLKEVLLEKGHKVQLERVTAENEDPKPNEPIRLNSKPDISKYDLVIFGAPVRAFSLSPILNAYLTQLSGLNGKKTACFVTEQFPKQWMGGNHAIKQMIRIITQKGSKVSETGVVNWSGKAKEAQIKDILERFSKL